MVSETLLTSVEHAETEQQSASLPTLRESVLENSLGIEDVETIIQIWKGKASKQSGPTSPIGDWDVDGTLSLGKLNAGEVYAWCDSFDPDYCQSYTYYDTRQPVICNTGVCPSLFICR